VRGAGRPGATAGICRTYLTRYIHFAIEVIDERDVEWCVELRAAFVMADDN
jgi:putative aminopeptidase FrvX